MNEASGVSPTQSREREDQIRTALEHAGVVAQVRKVEGRHIAASARDAMSHGTTKIVAAGGDGTISAVAGALAGHPEVAMGVLPTGTLNHFAKDLGIPIDLPTAAQVIADGHVRAVDVVEVGDHVFVNNASIGVYPFMVRRRDEIRRRWGQSGKWTAMAAAALSFLRRHPMVHARIRVHDRCEEQATPFVFVGNNNYQMNLLSLGKRTDLDRGELCLYFARRTGRLGLIRLAFRALLGRLKQDRDFEAMCVPEVQLESHRRTLLLAMDGEVVEVAPPLLFRTRPGALRVLAPPPAPAAVGGS